MGMKQGIHFGLKVGSKDATVVSDISRLYREQMFHYIELYVVQGTYETAIVPLKSLNIPFVIHAPHTGNGVNLADPERMPSNLEAYQEAKRFADALSAEVIIAHGGCDGSIDEAIRQLRMISDERICIENKPVKGLKGEECRGSSSEEIKRIITEGGASGFVLDFGHAVYAARSLGISPVGLIKEFLDFSPRLYHLADGDKGSEVDVHLNLGRGDFDLKELLSFVPVDSMLTIETPRDPSKGLHDFVRDIGYVENVIG